MNECGELNLARFEKYITELAKIDHERYAYENDSFKHLDKLTGRDKNSSKSQPESEKKKDEEEDMGFGVFDKLNEPPKTTVKKKPIDLPPSPSSSSSSSDDEDDDDVPSDSDISNEKSSGAEKKSAAKIPKKSMLDEIDTLPLIEAEFRQHKNFYYRNKMGINLTSTNELKVYVEQYIEALQWILKYYYQGCPSWSWFYPHHYAPYLSDLKDFKDLKFNFQRGTPFKPYEQLLSKLFLFLSFSKDNTF